MEIRSFIIIKNPNCQWLLYKHSQGVEPATTNRIDELQLVIVRPGLELGVTRFQVQHPKPLIRPLCLLLDRKQNVLMCPMHCIISHSLTELKPFTSCIYYKKAKLYFLVKEYSFRCKHADKHVHKQQCN